jgi:DeoR/GlpR family transcriptional regulator of sugar metabolism
VYLGSHGLDARTGLTTPNILEAETNRALIEAGRRLVVLVDHTKWGTIGISAVARLEDADTVITDTGLDSAARTLIAAAVRNLVLVDPATGDAQVFGEDSDQSQEGDR